MLDFFANLIMEGVPTWIAEGLFGRVYEKLDSRIQNQTLKILLMGILIVLSCLVGLSLAVGILVGFVFLAVKIFNIA